jgi:hypothetical protein
MAKKWLVNDNGIKILIWRINEEDNDSNENGVKSNNDEESRRKPVLMN